MMLVESFLAQEVDEFVVLYMRLYLYFA
jgi:hypothetical protein